MPTPVSQSLSFAKLLVYHSLLRTLEVVTKQHILLPPATHAIPTEDSPLPLYLDQRFQPSRPLPYSWFNAHLGALSDSLGYLAAATRHQRQEPFSQSTREHHPPLPQPFTAPRIHQGTAKDLARRDASIGRGLSLRNQVWVCVTACLIHSFSTPAPPPTPLCFLSRRNQLQMVPLLQSS